MKQLAILLLFSWLSTFVTAQVTTSSITGTAKSNTAQNLAGATVTAIHLPTGTRYTATTGSNGSFNLPNLLVGGPYELTVSYTGFAPFRQDSITLLLGQPYTIDAVLGVNVQALETVVVTGSRGRRVPDKTGTSTNISNRQLNTLPSINRTITDFTRLTPQAGANNSFGGRDPRYNNIQIDGANLNNNFGLSNDPLPGGGNPVSLDAIEEISVNISPFDVRQAGFTGAGINAVTRSGNNKFTGSVYGFYRNEDFSGTKVGKTTLPPAQKTSNGIYGFRLGGPILKNKLFFFVNAERETREFPGVLFRPTQSGLPPGGNVSATPIDSMRKLEDFLTSKYGYNPGANDNFPNFNQKNTKLLGRVDWNVTDKHRATVRYSDFKNTNDVLLNNTSIPGGGFGVLTRLGNNRFGNNSMGFENSNYGFEDKVQSGTFEINSRFSNLISNQFLATYTKIRDTRTFNGGVFPTIDILNLPPGDSINNQNYLHVGMDPFTYNNDVINNIWSLIDNFTRFAGKHTITAGVSYEHQKVGNMFMPGSNSYYIFRSLNDFITNQPPAYYAYTYSLIKGEPQVYSAELKIGQLGIYAQDEYILSNHVRLTYGLRVDRPLYDDQPIANPAVEALTFLDENGAPTHYTTGKWPESKWYWSPRIGARWDVKGDKSTIIRGGTGIFTGRIPFVWLTNIPTNSAMYQVTASVNSRSALVNFPFNPNPDAYNDVFPKTAGTTIVRNSNFVFANPDFKFPQVWRSNVAWEQGLGKGFNLTVEALYTKELNSVYMRNANLRPPDTVFTGPDARPRYTSNSRLNADIASAIVLENTSKGGTLNLTAQVTKAFTKGFYGSLGYNYTLSKNVTGNPGSQAISAWNTNPNKTTGNALELGYSEFATPHRIVGAFSYRKEYAKNFATTLTLFYEGSQTVYSYTYSADINGDQNGFDLIYIPRNQNEIIFTPTTIGGVAYTPQQQWDIYNQFIEQDPYLSKHRGEYAERNAARIPFYHRIDARLLQDFFIIKGGRRHTLQFSADVLNIPNLLNRDWGVQQTYVQRSILVPTSVVNGQPTFRLNSANNKPVTESFQDVVSTASTWGLQLGLRYSF
ncbi:TonB-dependent receptor [Flavisolibacter tropicus]|uniref:TonB-dependent transporter Oar-like beta-barrel domain-containing protein n=1 Tax=Flavisolibacter tropicus TaxID=1492898 RepID=A0A172TUR8_9BACT|nr:carboxypeptidase regulatory-like domain-containing protein [Flavisolibacter tropicus]ANE50742.1 hypothetical protein SY85_09770 [Flavisolibacter tropicus]